MRQLSVRKIGGENAAQFKANAELARTGGENQILVFSAPRRQGFNTTSHINAAAQAVLKGDMNTAQTELDEVEVNLKQIVSEETESEVHTDLQAVISSTMLELREVISSAESIQAVGKDYRTESGLSVTGYGELIAQRLYARYFERLGLSHTEFNLQSINQVNDELNQYQGGLAISGGYIDEYATTRGYSDATGARIARYFDDRNINVDFIIAKQTAVQTGDPRSLENTRVVNSISYDVAEPMCSRNGVVHERVFPIIKGSNVSIHVLGSDGTSTWITPEAHVPSGQVQTMNVIPGENHIEVTFHGPNVNGPVTAAATEVLRDLGVANWTHRDLSHTVEVSLPITARHALQPLHDVLTAQA